MIHAGCYDAPTVAPYPEPWLIDDFSNTNGYPIDPHFEPWGCRPFDDAHPMSASDCNVTTDPYSTSDDHKTVLHLGAWLYPLSNDDIFDRAEVATYVRDAQEYDLRPYARFMFSWKIIIKPSAPLNLDLLRLKLQIFCTRTPAAHGGVPSRPFLVDPIAIPTPAAQPEDNDWVVGDVKLADFGPAEDLVGSDKVKYEQDCLAHADGFKFTIDSNYRVYEGYKARVDLYIDDVKLEPQ
jgi:hypothetical protein